MNIAIIDDNLELRRSIVSLLELNKEFKIVGSFSSAIDCVPNLKFCNPHIVLLDIEMPEMDGIQALELIVKALPEVKVVMQTVFENDEKVFEALSKGASGYILKSNINENIYSYLKEAKEGGAPFSPLIAAKLMARMQKIEGLKIKNSEAYALSKKEKEVLVLLTQGYANKSIANELFVSQDTIKTHIKNIYKKLHVSSKVEAVAKAFKENLV